MKISKGRRTQYGKQYFAINSSQHLKLEKGSLALLTDP